MAPICFLIRFSPFFHLLYATSEIGLTSPGSTTLFEDDTLNERRKNQSFELLRELHQKKIANTIYEFYQEGRTDESAESRAQDASLRIKSEFASCGSEGYYLSPYYHDTDHRNGIYNVVGTEYKIIHLEFREVERELTERGWKYYYKRTSISNNVKEFNDVGVSGVSKMVQKVRGFFQRKAKGMNHYTTETVPRYVLLFVKTHYTTVTDNETHYKTVTDNFIFVKRKDGRSFTLNDLKKLDWAKDMVQSLVDRDGV